MIEQAGPPGRPPARTPTTPSVKRPRVLSAVPGEPTYESFFPYLPLMTVFGLPTSTTSRSGSPTPGSSSAWSPCVAAVALALCRAPSERRVRALQVLTVLPTAALPLATGGDDMPIVAFLLLAWCSPNAADPARAGWCSGWSRP